MMSQGEETGGISKSGFWNGQVAIYGWVQAGAVIFNAVSVEDIVFKDDRVSGVVILWTPVGSLDMHVDPLVITAKAVIKNQ